MWRLSPGCGLMHSCMNFLYLKRKNAETFFSTKTTLTPAKIIRYFVLRWNIEVTFEETRAHLGIET